MLIVVTNSIQPLTVNVSQLETVGLENFILRAGFFNLQATTVPQLINVFIF